MTLTLIAISVFIVCMIVLHIVYNEGYDNGHTDALDLDSDDLTEVHIVCCNFPTRAAIIIGVHTTLEGAIAERDFNRKANMYNVSRGTSWHVLSKPLIKD